MRDFSLLAPCLRRSLKKSLLSRGNPKRNSGAIGSSPSTDDSWQLAQANLDHMTFPLPIFLSFFVGQLASQPWLLASFSRAFCWDGEMANILSFAWSRLRTGFSRKVENPQSVYNGMPDV